MNFRLAPARFADAPSDRPAATAGQAQRRRVAALAVPLLLLGLALASPAFAAAGTKLNVLFIAVDDQPRTRINQPMKGIEPPTCCLQNSCSTVELHRR